jgi:hypothetical protein
MAFEPIAYGPGPTTRIPEIRLALTVEQLLQTHRDLSDARHVAATRRSWRSEPKRTKPSERSTS